MSVLRPQYTWNTVERHMITWPAIDVDGICQSARLQDIYHIVTGNNPVSDDMMPYFQRLIDLRTGNKTAVSPVEPEFDDVVKMFE